MKTGVFSFLFGVSLLFELSVFQHVNAFGGINIPGLDLLKGLPGVSKECLLKALKEDGDLLMKLGIAICAKDAGKLDDKAFKAVYEQLAKALEKTTCAATLGLVQLGETAGTLSEVGATVIETVRGLLKETDLNDDVMGLACELFGSALNPECLPKLLSRNLAELLQEIYDKCQGDPPTIPLDSVFKILGEKLQCTLTPKTTAKRGLEILAETVCPVLITLLEFLGAVQAS